MTLHDRTRTRARQARDKQTRPSAAVLPEALEGRQLFADVLAALAAPHDTYARDGGFANQQFGTSGELVVAKTGSTGNQRQAFVRFDVGPASGGTVTRAVLRLHGRAANIGGSAAANVSLLPVPQTIWAETGVTWNKRPPQATPALGTRPVRAAAGWVEWDVTSYVAAQRRAGKAQVAFSAIAGGVSGAVVSFASSEAAANRPVLVLSTRTNTPVPPPPTNPPPTNPPPTNPPPTNPNPPPTTPVPQERPAVRQASPAGLGVQVGAGTVTLPSGERVAVRGGYVALAAPPVQSHVWTGPTPPNYANQAGDLRWPDNAANLVPPVDTVVLGGLYRSVIPGSVVVRNAETGRVYAKDVDYKLNAEWGQVLNLNGRMSGALRIEYRAAIQRLDLIQVWPDGSLSVKQGVPMAVAPELPVPDAGAAALAGVHVATLDGPRTSGFQVLDRDVHVVRPEVGPAAPINPGALPNTLARLRNRQGLRVTFFGDSITAGAEAGQWWRDRSKTYTSLVVNGLRQRFPGADVTETAQASVVGRSVADGEPAFQQQVLNPHNAGSRTDLLVIALGMNDKGLPNTDAFERQLAGYVDRAKAAGMEVLLVTPMDSNPHFAPWFNIYAPRGRIAEAIRQVARSTGTAAADVYADWVNQSARGVAPVSQLHNWFNHPGERGMRLYADALLRLFPA